MGCEFEPGRCPKNAALEKTGFAWQNGLFQKCMVAKPTSALSGSVLVPLSGKDNPLEWAVTDVCGRAKTQQ
jgi:hypothetical protein